MDRKTNEEIHKLVDEERNIMETIENRRGKIVGHLARHDILLTMEGKIERKRSRERDTQVMQFCSSDGEN